MKSSSWASSTALVGMVILAAASAGHAARLASDEVAPPVVPDQTLAVGVAASQPSSSGGGAAVDEDLLLGSVVNGRVTGLAQLDFSQRTRVRVLAERYVAFRKKRLNASEGARWIRECRDTATRSVFCREQDYQPADSEPDIRGVLRKKSKRAPEVEAKLANQALKSGELDTLLASSESAINQGLRRISNFEEVRATSEKVLKASSCDVSPLNTMIAQKLEEFLPDQGSRIMLLKLHEHAASCKNPSEWTSRSKYRLSLLLIAQGDWEKAEKWLEQLALDRTSDYFSRSLYWRARAAKVRGNHLAYEQAKARLTREFPIHYHSLLLAGKKAFNAALSLHLPEPVVRMDSAVLGDRWNERVRAIETLQEQGAVEYTRHLFSELEELMDKAEPEARLYLAVLQNRNFNSIGTFRTLSSLMRDHPAVLSKQTLSLFFPLSKKHRHILYTFAGGGLDPYILAALIRQESGFIPTARSPAGALGLMQLMPATARRMERVSKRELLDGRTNVRLGVKFFKRLLEKFSGKVDLALAAYNAGPHRVDDWVRRYQVDDPVLFVDLIPFRETREYVSLISRNYYWYLQLYARHIFDERLEASRKPSKDGRTPASGSLALEFSLFSAH